MVSASKKKQATAIVLKHILPCQFGMSDKNRRAYAGAMAELLK
jgi:AICAR transformylase/IMP cyclohydrolase PurH